MKKEQNFNSSKYWENRYKNGGNSGAGSYNHLAKFKAQIINNFIDKYKVENVYEFGCGDGNNLSLYNIKNYVGIDVSSKAINICKTKFSKDLNKQFFLIEEFTKNKINNQKRELVLSLDVIYHLIEDNIYNEYMNNLFDNSTKFVIIYASNYEEEAVPHVKHRKFTNWIDINKKDWFLKEFIKNKYPFDINKPKETTFADFYIFEKNKV